jgi:hypothetical protein
MCWSGVLGASAFPVEMKATHNNAISTRRIDRFNNISSKRDKRMKALVVGGATLVRE